MATNKTEKTLDDLFLDSVKDVYYAEKKIVKTLPKMVKATNSPDLKAAFEKHLSESEGHVERLEQVFELLGKPARGKTCPAIDGILEEGAEVMDEYKGTAALDSALVASAQAVEHYEIARYGTLATWARSSACPTQPSCSKQRLARKRPPTRRCPPSARVVQISVR
jgi:ferritin-like metal-binding protein YciE